VVQMAASPNSNNTTVVNSECGVGAAAGGGSGSATVNGSATSPFGQQGEDRLKGLYPMVDEDDTPLPRSWNSKDKFTNLGLSQNNIRVHYKGITTTSGPRWSDHFFNCVVFVSRATANSLFPNPFPISHSR